MLFKKSKLGMEAHSCNPSLLEAESGILPQDRPRLHGEALSKNRKCSLRNAEGLRDDNTMDLQSPIINRC